MAGFTGASPIVTDGLVFAVDAANYKSYQGSGTTWTDLASSNNGTLTNGPTFDSGNGGSIDFDGSNDYIDFGDFDNTQVSSAITLSIWYPIPIPSRAKGNNNKDCLMLSTVTIDKLI